MKFDKEQVTCYYTDCLLWDVTLASVGMAESEYRPGGELVEAGSRVNPFDALVQRQQLNLPDIGQYYDMWVNLLSESAGYIPRPMTRTIENVSLGLGFLFYQQWGEMGYTGQSKQVAFQKRLQRYEDYQGQLVLTYEEGVMLRDAATAVNYVYDPGEPEDTPENLARRTFNFTDLEQKTPHEHISEPRRVVEAER